MLLLVLMVVVVRSELQMFPGNYTINAQTYYTVSIIPLTTPIDVTGWTILSLPSDSYSTSQLAAAVCSLSCTRTGENFNCSNGLYASNLLQFNITSIVNPPSAVSPYFIYNIYSAGGVST
jgi:hypothetical protein